MGETLGLAVGVLVGVLVGEVVGAAVRMHWWSLLLLNTWRTPWCMMSMQPSTHLGCNPNVVFVFHVAVASCCHSSHKLYAQQLAVDQGPQAGSHPCPRTIIINYYYYTIFGKTCFVVGGLHRATHS